MIYLGLGLAHWQFPVSGVGAIPVGMLPLLIDLLTPVIYYGNKKYCVAWRSIPYLRATVEGAKEDQKETNYIEIFPGWIDLWRPWLRFILQKVILRFF